MTAIDLLLSETAAATGPGSQPTEADGATLDYLPMPKGMQTYHSPLLPEPEEVAGLDQGLDLLRRLLGALGDYRPDTSPTVLDLTTLPAADHNLVTQALGEGEVSALVTPPEPARIQETRLAGVWRVLSLGADGQPLSDQLEVADIPARVRDRTFLHARTDPDPTTTAPLGVVNAPSILAELADQVAKRQPGDDPHVVNLTLLPQTPEDLAHLEASLGTGPITLLSRGYGNCRVRATALRNLWWVQHFNSDDRLILNTLEVTEVPAAVLAAPEDLADSAQRLAEILEAVA